MRTTVALLLLAIGLHAQPKPSAQLPLDFIQFFQGEWAGKGAFANGKVIEADLSFALILDSCWLQYKHIDRQPNRYQATSLWGQDNNGQFMAYSFANFHGHRKFNSNGWHEGKLVLTTSEYYAGTGWVYQQFTYEKLSDHEFKMTFETSKDARLWKMGDYLIFTKKQ